MDDKDRTPNVNVGICEGCDQENKTTRDRVARVRATGASSPVRYCDDCTSIVNAGQHDTYDRVTDETKYPPPPGDSSSTAGMRMVDRPRNDYSTDPDAE